ncbi:peptide chain release factor 1 [Cutibacterium acnes JCM 18916]|nr:peptide chain release factor 1 [Cutibacterium acnes JCM 18916]GAE74796.1 peptide chain release factor 1 [Cutibacterium acnes JCM 18918]
MSESAQQAIDEVRRRLREIETQLADSAVLSDPSAMGSSVSAMHAFAMWCQSPTASTS